MSKKMRAKLKVLQEKLWDRMHQRIVQTGAWLASVGSVSEVLQKERGSW
jgi:hypothetical protein